VRRKIPTNQPLVACTLEQSKHAIEFSGGHPQGDLYNQRNRILEQRDSKSDQKYR